MIGWDLTYALTYQDSCDGRNSNWQHQESGRPGSDMEHVFGSLGWQQGHRTELHSEHHYREAVHSQSARSLLRAASESDKAAYDTITMLDSESYEPIT